MTEENVYSSADIIRTVIFSPILTQLIKCKLKEYIFRQKTAHSIKRETRYKLIHNCTNTRSQHSKAFSGAIQTGVKPPHITNPLKESAQIFLFTYGSPVLTSVANYDLAERAGNSLIKFIPRLEPRSGVN